ncbi:MAG: Crp/Fnr family transcriptional regulator [Marinicaulis sp.]|nr:Crp/Fnr family transcriptional regulator [Marinicaulis sp.]
MPNEKQPFRLTAFMELLPADLADAIKRRATMRRYANDQFLHSRGDPDPGLSIVKSGAVKVGVYGLDGAFILTSILGPGQTFGEFTLFAGLPRTHDAAAVGDTEVYHLRAAEFLPLFERHREIGHALLAASLQRLHVVIEILDAMRRLPVRERTAKILFLTVQTMGAAEHLQIRQTEIAQMLGVSRVTMNRALQELSQLGLIAIGYGEIKIVDVAQFNDWIDANCNVSLEAG